jgi:hypothetical protein
MSASEIHGHEYTVKYQSNPPRVKIIDETVIPGAYLITRQETVIDRKSISEALKEGHAVPGAELERTQRLVVKTQTKKGRPALIEKAKAEAELSAAVVANSNGGVSENGNPAAGSTEAAGATAVQ